MVIKKTSIKNYSISKFKIIGTVCTTEHYKARVMTDSGFYATKDFNTYSEAEEWCKTHPRRIE